MNLRILVTAIGSFSAHCVISNLKKLGHIVIGTDIYPKEWHHITKICDEFIRVPFATSDNYILYIKKICEELSINAIIPLTDLEIDVLRKYKSDFTQLGCHLFIEPDNVLDIARNKLKLSNTFKDEQFIKVPQFFPAEIYLKDKLIASEDLIAKPINGRSSEGLYKINKGDNLNFLIGKCNYIIQNYITGSIFTVDYVRDSFGNDFAVPREELLRTKNGAGITIKITNNIDLIKAAKFIGENLGIIGCVNMEFIQNNDEYYFIDLNPRFSAGIGFTQYLGYNIVESHLNSFIGKNINPPIKIEEQILEKLYIEVSNK